MLSLSADTTQSKVDLESINGDRSASLAGILYGDVLLSFAEAFADREEDTLAAARNTLLREGGADVLIEAAGVAANFQRMVRIADSIGIPIDEHSEGNSLEVAEQLNLGRFASAQNTPGAS